MIITWVRETYSEEGYYLTGMWDYSQSWILYENVGFKETAGRNNLKVLSLDMLEDNMIEALNQLIDRTTVSWTVMSSLQTDKKADLQIQNESDYGFYVWFQG